MTVWFLEFRTAVSEDDDIAHDFSLLSFLLTFCSVHLLMLVRCIHILVISIAGCSAVLTRRLGWGWGCIRYPSTLSHSVTHSLTYSLTHTHNHPHSLTDTHTDTHTHNIFVQVHSTFQQGRGWSIEGCRHVDQAVTYPASLF